MILPEPRSVSAVSRRKRKRVYTWHVHDWVITYVWHTMTVGYQSIQVRLVQDLSLPILVERVRTPVNKSHVNHQSDSARCATPLSKQCAMCYFTPDICFTLPLHDSVSIPQYLSDPRRGDDISITRKGKNFYWKRLDSEGAGTRLTNA